MPWATFNRLELRIMPRDVASVPDSGPADAAVADLLTRPYIRCQLDAIGPDTIAAELREYGAWDAAELADAAACRARIVWVAVGDIKEGI
jgi:hypothetical protein